MARRSTWPFAHVPTNYRGCKCSHCGKVRWCIPVYHEEKPTPGQLIDGAHELLCWPCLGRDGDPLHTMR